LSGFLHVLLLTKRCFKILDVSTTKFGSWDTDDTAPHYFCRDHVGFICGEFVWIINEVSANSDPNLIWVAFGGAVVDDNLCIPHDSSIFQDASDFSVGEVEN
jgi:hypothetical protein